MDIISIAELVVSTASLLVMLFGINLGKRALQRKTIVLGKEAEERYKALEGRLPQECLFEDGPYTGGNKSTPQLEIEALNFDPGSMPGSWKDYKKAVRYYYRPSEDEHGIRIKVWHLTAKHARLPPQTNAMTIHPASPA